MQEQDKIKVPEAVAAAMQVKSGANWFYWVAGLSLVNSVSLLAGSTWGFVIGLGITRLIDSIAVELSKDIGFAGKVVFFMFDVFVAGVFAVFGFFAGKRHRWAFIVGMILYAIDGLLFLLIGDFLSIAFHGFALFCIFSGLKAEGRLRRMEQTPMQPAAAGVPPPAL